MGDRGAGGGTSKLADAIMGAMEMRACKKAQGWSEKEGSHLKDTPGDKTTCLRDCRPGSRPLVTQTSWLGEGGSLSTEGGGAVPCEIN